jgi:hypothetical protein
MNASLFFIVVAAISGVAALILLYAGDRGFAMVFGSIAIFWLIFALKGKSGKKQKDLNLPSDGR